MTTMTPAEIVAKAKSDPTMATVLLLAHIAWSLERIANAVDGAEMYVDGE